MGQLQQPVLATQRAAVGDDVWGGTAQDYDGVCKLGQLYRDLPGMVMGRAILLLVGPLVLFIDDDEP
jgi:hypothetical protein